ncbi:MAG: helix-turn-helix domain-containing protein [Alphaproteobacteria bacterium]|nr:helix-turn-helix domain-containing protein [Alphaproteobacteria bacterium]MBU1517165.1 helix-turn-helix domain-containing protein [Alphaproteobacteria bacterium]MBU2096502.1 helix-turn-helix domain-containing protein [Alphaproteobacteria bacterium]MBU2151654.1 helix-turn-helix domain-containing protein [Alphaproteobacteria bacterium]MBU2305468.1 helix-turn-helix domain-containing protein [Alphaproteobacteria bacterium]
MATQKHKPRNGELDVALGHHIRDLRRVLGDTQAGLGAKVGLTFQQIQKYENGANRISALMLIKLAEALNTTPTEILRSVDGEAAAPASSTEAERLLDAFNRISSPETRASVLRIVTALAAD